MKKIYSGKRMAAIVCAAVFGMSLGFPAAAADSTDTSNNTATTNDLNNNDIIDTSKTGSIHIYKYDITSASTDGVYTEGEISATGEEDTSISTLLTGSNETGINYAIQGVEFTYVRCGNIETYSYTSSSGTEIQLVYEIDAKLFEILDLTSDDIYDMSNTANPCSNTSLYHVTSTVLIDALSTILEADDIEAKNQLEAYVTDNADAVTLEETDENGYTGASNLELGLYLIVETAVPENVVSTTDPFFVSLPFTDDDGEEWLYDLYVYPKNQTGAPDLDKSVKLATGEAAYTTGDSEDITVSSTSKVDTTANYISSNLIDDGTQTAADYVGSRTEYTYSDTVTASAGEILDYILVSRLPEIHSTATYLTEYTFTDVLCAGLTYNQDVSIAFYHSKTDAEVNNTVNADIIWSFNETGQLFDQEYVEIVTGYNSSTGETSLTVSFTEEGLKLINERYNENGAYGELYECNYMVIYYTATVNSNSTLILGDDGNVNNVTLTWKRTNSLYYETLEDRCYVYSYGVDTTKIFSDNGGTFSDVEFNLYNETDGYYIIADQVANVDGTTVYYVTGKTIDQSAATVFSPSTSGTFLVYGVEADTYQFTELSTSSGYTLLKDQVIIAITSTDCTITPAYITENSTEYTDLTGNDAYSMSYDKIAMIDDSLTGGLTAATATVDSVTASMADSGNSANAIVQIEITNNKNWIASLPSTGGRGIYLLVLFGICAAAAGIYLVFRKKTT